MITFLGSLMHVILVLKDVFKVSVIGPFSWWFQVGSNKYYSINPRLSRKILQFSIGP